MLQRHCTHQGRQRVWMGELWGGDGILEEAACNLGLKARPTVKQKWRKMTSRGGHAHAGARSGVTTNVSAKQSTGQTGLSETPRRATLFTQLPGPPGTTSASREDLPASPRMARTGPQHPPRQPQQLVGTSRQHQTQTRNV